MKLNTISLAVAMALAGMSTQVQAAPDWMPVAGQVGTNDLWYIDKSSMSRTGSVVRHWDRVDYVNSTQAFKQAIILFEDDCDQGKARKLSATAYLKDGAPLTDNSVGEWTYLVPGSIGDIIHHHVCDVHR